jgi:hypothetical protein
LGSALSPIAGGIFDALKHDNFPHNGSDVVNQHYQESKRTASELSDDSNLIAHRYQCKVGGAHDNGQLSALWIKGEAQRRSVKLSFDLSIRPDAKHAVDSYQNDPSIRWEPLINNDGSDTIQAYVLNPGTGEYVVDSSTREALNVRHNLEFTGGKYDIYDEASSDLSVTLELQPREYQEGSLMQVFIANTVEMSDANPQDLQSRTVETRVGYLGLATFEFRAGEWRPLVDEDGGIAAPVKPDLVRKAALPR